MGLKEIQRLGASKANVDDEMGRVQVWLGPLLAKFDGKTMRLVMRHEASSLSSDHIKEWQKSEATMQETLSKIANEGKTAATELSVSSLHT